jgi:hypothetical protein
MRARSIRRAKEYRVYLPLREQYLIENPRCRRCGRPSVDVHHRRGRTGQRLLDMRWWAASCRACNSWAEDCTTSAPYDEGWKVHKDVEVDPWDSLLS